MKRLRNIIIATAVSLFAAMSGGACHSIDSWENDLYGNFDALWQILDEHYCFFDAKQVDWNKIGSEYRKQIDPEWDAETFFAHCANMLAELHDGHTNLISWFDVSYYRKWWSDYPQNFDLRLIEEHYLGFDYHSGSGFIYKYLDDRKVGYVRYSSFSSNVSHSFIDMMMLSMKDADGMILDLRDNSGGDMTNVEKIVAHFLRETTLAGYIVHKTGPRHNDFSEPFPYYYEPVEDHVRWYKPVIILTNRSTFSAANNFVAIMKTLPYVAIVGDTTGGGSGMPFSSEIPCGWSVRFSAAPVYDADMNLTEYGIDPSPGGKIDLDMQLAINGIDSMLEFAIETLNRVANEAKKSPAETLYNSNVSNSGSQI